jgi:hypothetical protein
MVTDHVFYRRPRGDSIDTMVKIGIGVTEPDNPGKHAY